MKRTFRISGSMFLGGAHSIGAVFYVMDDESVQAHVEITSQQEGPPNHAHGGILASLLDEAMGASAWAAGHRVLAVNLNISFRKPVPVGALVHVAGRVERVEGRKVFTTGAITLPDGTHAVDGTGLFVVAPQLFERAGFTFTPVEREEGG